MHNESNKVRSITATTPVDRYSEVLKQILLDAIREEDAREPGPMIDGIIFNMAMLRNWEFPVSCSGLYSAIGELEQSGVIDYDEDTCEITLVRNTFNA